MQQLVSEPRAQQEALSVDLVDSLDGLRAFDTEWLSLCRHAEAHPATFEAVCRANVDLIRPYVVLVRREGRAVALAIARIQHEAVPVRFGFATLLAPKLRVVRVSYEGISCDNDADAHARLMATLAAPLLQGEADALFFDHMRENTAAFAWATAPLAPAKRDLAPVKPTTHWIADVSGDFASYLDRLSKTRRRDFAHSRNRITREFGSRYTVVCYRAPADYDIVERDTAAIASQTYHKTLGVSFVDQFWSRPLFKSGLEANLARCYISYVDGRPAAFYHGLTWRGVFSGSMTGYHPDFAAAGVGRALVQHIVEDLCNTPDIAQFDFGFGHAFYKSRIGTASWTETDRYVFAPRLRPTAINGTRGAIEGMARLSDATISALGLRTAIKSKWWQRTIDKPSSNA